MVPAIKFQTVLLLPFLAPRVFADSFNYPAEGSTIKNGGDLSKVPVFKVGDQQQILWNTDTPGAGVRLALWQNGNPGVQQLLCGNCTTGLFNWGGRPAQDLKDGNLFFLQLYTAEGGTSPLATSRYFNMTDGATTSTTSSTTSASSTTSSTSAAPTAGSQITKSGSTTSATTSSTASDTPKDTGNDATKIGLGVGLGVGISIVLAAAALLFFRHRRKKSGIEKPVSLMGSIATNPLKPQDGTYYQPVYQPPHEVYSPPEQSSNVYKSELPGAMETPPVTQFELPANDVHR